MGEVLVHKHVFVQGMCVRAVYASCGMHMYACVVYTCVNMFVRVDGSSNETVRTGVSCT